MKMVQEGKSVEEMRDAVIGRYGNFGPSTDGDGQSLGPLDLSGSQPLTLLPAQACGGEGSLCE